MIGYRSLAWRPAMIGFGSALCLVLMAGCRSDLASWRERLARPEVQGLVGLWNVELRRDAAGRDSTRGRWVTGQIAFTLNDGRLDGPGSFDEPPMFFGSYNIDFRRVGFGAAAEAGMPAVVGRLRGGTLELQLAPQSKLPISVTAVLAKDSIFGRWTAHQRAGPDAVGDFMLRKR